MKISLVIPAYNEERFIRKTLMAYKSCLEKITDSFEIIAVNDGSCDKTLDEIKKVDKVVCVTYDKNRGKGYAVKRGILRASGDYIFFTDADLSYAPSDIKRAVDKLETSGANIIIGERITKKEKYSPLRRLASKVLQRILSKVLKINAKDSQCGFKGFDKETAKQIFSRIECEDFGFDFEVLSIAGKMGKRCASISLEFEHRESSRVKLFSDSVKMLKQITRLAQTNKDTAVVFEKRRQIIFFATFFLLCIFRLSYLGYRYTPYLDDYVQYMLYPALDNPWQRVLTGGAGVLFTRPLAGLTDFFIWSGFVDHLGLAVIIISAMYAMSAIFFYKTFCDLEIELTPCFLIFYAFLPINIEGTYWLSASSRIVVSLLFVSLCCRFLLKEKNILFWLCNAVSMCFYEQTAILAVLLPIIICIFNKKDKKQLRPVVLTLINITVLGLYYVYFGKMSNNSSRIGLDFSKLSERFSHLARETAEMWGSASTELMLNGLRRGAEKIISDRAYLWFIVLAFLILLLFLSTEKNKYKKKNIACKLWLGVGLTLAPMIPFLVSQNILNFRNAVPSLLGVALVFDGIVPWIFKKATPLFLMPCIMCFTIVAVSEVSDYDLTARRDMDVAYKVAQSIPKEQQKNIDRVVLNCTAPVRFEQNCQFNDHIMSIRGSVWGISGMVKAVMANEKGF